MTNPLLSNPRPWCIGRFLLDRPAVSEISNQRYEFRGEKLETQYRVSLEAYRVISEAREHELRSKQRINPVGLSEKTGHAWLEKSFSPTVNSRVFVYQQGVAKAVKLPFESEGYIFIKPHTAIQLLLGASSPDLTPEQATSPVDAAGAIQAWETLLSSL